MGDLAPRQQQALKDGLCPWCMGRGRRLLDRDRDQITGMMVNGPSRCRDCDGSGRADTPPAPAS